MRFRAINSQNVATFFPTQKWKDEISCALFSDINPEFDNLLPLGTKIMFPFDEKLIFGTVLSVSGRNATVDRKSTRLNSSHIPLSRMPSSA